MKWFDDNLSAYFVLSPTLFNLRSSINLIPFFLHFKGNLKCDENPTHYRSPRQYIDICQSRLLNGTPEYPHDQVYELIFAKALESYYAMKKNNNQVI